MGERENLEEEKELKKLESEFFKYLAMFMILYALNTILS